MFGIVECTVNVDGSHTKSLMLEAAAVDPIIGRSGEYLVEDRSDFLSGDSW